MSEIQPTPKCLKAILHHLNNDTVTEQYYVGKKRSKNMKALENCMLFTIERKLQKEENSNCPEHSSSNRI